MTNAPADDPRVPLQCLGGAAAPRDLLAAWRCVLRLPATALEPFAAALQQGLAAAIDGAAAVRELAAATAVAAEDLAAALQGCGHLLRSASVLDLDGEAFGADLAALTAACGGPGAGAGAAAPAVLRCYEAQKPLLRQQGLQQALADHGRLLVGLNWRVDRITASDRGLRLDTDVVFLTLVCRDGAELERITVQLTPSSLQALRSFCRRFDG